MSKHAAVEIDEHLVQRQALRLVDRDGIGEAQRHLLERADDFALHLLGFRLQIVAVFFPGSRLDFIDVAADVHDHALAGKPFDNRQ